MIDCTKKHFEDFDQDIIHIEPLLFTSFTTESMHDEVVYIDVKSQAQVRGVLEKRLAEYNNTNAIMDLVLFDQAVAHVCRISRIIENPSGNALLVGVGGSGKQSLCRLAAYINELNVVTLSVTSDYGVADLKEHLKTLYHKAGVKPANPLVFMLTDAMIVDEKFLVFINDLLSSGYIPGLFTAEEYDGVFALLRNEAKASGVPDTRDTMMEFFIPRTFPNSSLFN